MRSRCGDEGAASGDRRVLDAYVDEDGNLVLEGQNLGPTVSEVFGDLDDEYWRKVKKEGVPKVLLLLIEARFDSALTFTKWLNAHGIESEFHSGI